MKSIARVTALAGFTHGGVHYTAGTVGIDLPLAAAQYHERHGAVEITHTTPIVEHHAGPLALPEFVEEETQATETKPANRRSRRK